MPIRFRCKYCNRLLGIGTRKAGLETICPHCGLKIVVPVPPREESARTERIDLEDVDELLNRGGLTTAADSAVGQQPPVATSSRQQTAEPLTESGSQSHVGTERIAHTQEEPRHPPPLPPAEHPTRDPDNPPLFEGDVDEILGHRPAVLEQDRPVRPATTGVDALTLTDPPRNIVLTSQIATLLLATAVGLMLIAFVAGYYLAGK